MIEHSSIKLYMYSTAPWLSPQGLHIRYHEILFSPMYTLKSSFMVIKPGKQPNSINPRHTRLPRVQKFSPMIAKKFIFARYDPHIPWSPIFQMKSPLTPVISTLLTVIHLPKHYVIPRHQMKKPCEPQ